MSPREALRTLHRAGRIASPWMGGMLVDNGRGRRERIPERFVEPADGLDWEPVVDDPATCGRLLQLLREAANDRRLYVCAEGVHEGRVDRWVVEVTPGAPPIAEGRRKGEAVAAALIALARTVSP